MRDDVYVGNLVSEEEFRHSSGPWKKHAYVKKTQEDGYTRYWYPENLKGKRKGPIQNGASNEELQAAEDEYAAAEAAYRKDPSPENRKRLDEAEEEVSRARAIKRRDGNYEEKSTKEELKKNAKQKGKELLSSLDPRGRANDSVGTRSMPENSEAEDRKKKRKSLSLFNHGVRHTGSKKKNQDGVMKLEDNLSSEYENSHPSSSRLKNPTAEQNKKGANYLVGRVKETVDHYNHEKERAEKIDQWYKDGKPVITDQNESMYLTRSGGSLSSNRPVARKKNVLNGSARVNASSKSRSGEAAPATLAGKINRQQNSLINNRRKGLIGSDTYHKLLSGSNAFNSKRYEAYEREEGARDYKKKRR